MARKQWTMMNILGVVVIASMWLAFLQPAVSRPPKVLKDIRWEYTVWPLAFVGWIDISEFREFGKDEKGNIIHIGIDIISVFVTILATIAWAFLAATATAFVGYSFGLWGPINGS